MLRRVIALQIGVLGPHVLTGCALGKGTCCIRGRVQFGWSCRQVLWWHGAVAVEPIGGGLVQASFSRQAAWRLGEQLLWGQKWLHWVWGPCLVVGAQGDTLKAWVVKLLGGLSASARAQRTFDSLFLWRVLTLQWGSQVQSEEKVVGAQVAWVVKLLGGLSASACAQRTFDSLFLWRVLTLQWGSQVQSEEKVVGAQEAWVVKLLGGLSASAVHKEL